METEDMMHFKQFSLCQEGCGMRIGTDGVLLGGWALSDVSSTFVPPGHILDVGTGTGLIVLMLAQRFPDARLVGVEIEEQASQTARKNAFSSPFAHRVSIEHADFTEYASGIEAHSVDLLISNPPFFASGVATRSRERTQARYTHSLAPKDLLHWAQKLLTDQGRLAMITPFEQIDALRVAAASVGLVPDCLVSVVTVEGKAPKRLLSQWVRSGRETSFCPLKTLCIRTKEGEYTAEYRALLSPFYLFL